MIETAKTNTESVSDDFVSNSDKVIPRYYIKTGKLTRQLLRQMIEVDHVPLDEEVETEYQVREKLKKELKDWSRNRIRQIQYEEAINQGMNISSWEDIGHSWQHDDSAENQERMFQIMYGVFERDSKWPYGKTWSSKLEEEFMREYNLRYDRPEPLRKASRRRTPAGIEDIIKTERPELNKLLNLRTKMDNSHGKMIVAIGRVGKSSRQPNGIKRKKGVFYSEFIRYHKSKCQNDVNNNTVATNKDSTVELPEKAEMIKKKSVMDNNENVLGRKIIEKAIIEQSRKWDAEQIEELQGIKDKKPKKSKSKKQKKRLLIQILYLPYVQMILK